MSKFLFLLHDEDANLLEMPAETKQELFNRFVVWTESLKEKGVLRAVESLMDTGGSTLRRKRDELVVDGPYAELKEMVTGLFVVEVASRSDAEQLASGCPLLGVGGAVEVREIAPFPVQP
ncbi:MAG: YciI family protein [Polyangiaceae bacterium]